MDTLVNFEHQKHTFLLGILVYVCTAFWFALTLLMNLQTYDAVVVDGIQLPANLSIYHGALGHPQEWVIDVQRSAIHVDHFLASNLLS